MKKLLLSIIVLIVTILLTSCGSGKWSCKKRYAIINIESKVKEVDKCFIVLETNDTLYNIPSIYAFEVDGGEYTFTCKERYNYKCEVVQLDLYSITPINKSNYKSI